jgi:hypothetical protein
MMEMAKGTIELGLVQLAMKRLERLKRDQIASLMTGAGLRVFKSETKSRLLSRVCELWMQGHVKEAQLWC